MAEAQEAAGRKQRPWARAARRGALLLLLGALVAWTYTSSLIGVRAETRQTYRALKEELRRAGHRPRLAVLSGRRFAVDNWLLNTFGGASRNSRHLRGDAVDVLVLDVDGDGKADRNDVDIVYSILDQKLIGDSGGVGTYAGESGFFNRQMVHFDLRGHRARWHR